jgi:ribose transport system substrate-binding protein
MIYRRRGWSGRSVRTALVASVAAAGLALTACSSGTSGSSGDNGAGGDSAGSDKGKTYRIAFLASSSQNGYNQAVMKGLEEKAAEYGNVKVTILDGQFDAQVQFNQLQDAAASGKYDGIVIVPNDTVGIAAAVPDAAAKKIPIVTALFPIGPDLAKLKPQVDGIVSTVASPPAEGATKQAELAAEYCKDKNPCNVVLLIGQLQFPFDKLRHDSYKAVLAKHPNIKVVATAEGNYDRDQSLKAMTDVIQANKQIDVVLSNADQQTFGAVIALQNAGRDLSKMYITGGGGTTEAVKSVRDGLWKEAYLNFPVSMGQAALEQLINSLTGKPVTDVVDADHIGPLPPFVDKAALDAKPDFLGQWDG